MPFGRAIPSMRRTESGLLVMDEVLEESKRCKGNLNPSARKGREGERPQAPTWCRNGYRPRYLTEQGARVLWALDPEREGTAFPLGMGPNPNRSLEDRSAFLARRYTALDLLLRGQVFEAGGQYHHRRFQDDRDRLRENWLASLEEGEPGGPSEESLLLWTGLLRRPSWEQLFAVDSCAKRVIADRIERLRDQGLLVTEPVQLGRGEIETWCLTRKGLYRLREMEPRSRDFGWGPRQPLPNNREYHEQVVGDAIAWAMAEVREMTGKDPEAIWLDRGLRRIQIGETTLPDLRVEYEIGAGIGRYEMEIEGLGRDYRSAHHQAKVGPLSTYRVFNPKGNTRGGNHVAIGR